MTEQIHFFQPFAIEAKATAEGVVSGLASPFGGAPDAYGDTIAPGAFADSLARHKRSGTAPLMLWQHDPAKPVGRWQTITERPAGLYVEGRLNLQTAAGAETFAHLRAGDISGLSIGYTVPRGGAKVTRSGRELTKIDLVEISIVSLPASEAARVAQVKNAPIQLESRAALERLLRDAGLSRAAAEKIAAGGWPALKASLDPNLTEIAERLAQAAARMRA
jgi:HK97 family phage prohead protease